MVVRFIIFVLPQLALVLMLILVSGLSAAHTVYLAGGNVVVLDKQGMLNLRHLLGVTFLSN